MKVESALFYYLVAFFAIVAGIYAYFTGLGEWVGILGLGLTSVMCAMIAWYFGKSGRTVDLRPDDDPDGEIAQQAGPYGFFSPHSWWPLWLGASLGLLVLGVAIGWWMVIIATPFVAIASVGWVFEYFHGEKAI